MRAVSASAGPSRSHRLWWRVLWAAVLILHGPATIGALLSLWHPSQGHRSSILLLVASNSFFILEVIFAWSLRLFSSRRNLLVFALIIVLLHVGVMEQRGLIRSSDAQWIYCLLLTGIGACQWSAIIRWAAGRIDRTASPGQTLTRPVRRVVLNMLVPLDPQATWRAAPLRAPPCAAC